MVEIINQYQLGDMLAVYVSSENGLVELYLVPNSLSEKIKLRDGELTDSLLQFKLEGEAFSTGFANGHTMRNNRSIKDFTFRSQKKEKEQKTCKIITEFENASGLRVEHIVEYEEGYQGIVISCTFYNDCAEAATLEMLSSFSLGGITPFIEGEATGKLLLHRIKSKWSNEGRVETRTIEELQLEPTWSGWGVASEKFGQVGSMPVRKYFPFIAVEDIESQVVWAAELCCAGSWQMEAYRRDESLCISGGLADYDFGHWSKRLAKGQFIKSPKAYVTVCKGNLDTACQRLIGMQNKPLEIIYPYTQLPVIFNEFCTTWGNPTEKNILETLSKVKNRGFDYFVIDAGWYADPVKGWENNMGDWQVAEELFPHGLQETVNAIRNAGMKPGIWFEMEVVGCDASVYNLDDHLLKRHGKFITAGTRRFWDMRDQWTIDYLTEKVIGFLNKYGFEYLKVDYNETIGVGCDGAESLGEGLRQNMLASQEFFRKIRREVPGIVIEICASGGHRLEPSMLALGEMASFSDAHEQKEIPVIAANMHRVIQPKQSLIWAVLRKTDTLQRIVYSMTNTFLGIMCLSGDVHELNEEQWSMVQRGINFYKNISNIILSGHTLFYGNEQQSYRFLKGWQGVLRYSNDREEALLILHTFEEKMPLYIQVPLEYNYEIIDVFTENNKSITIENKNLAVQMDREFEACAIYMKRV